MSRSRLALSSTAWLAVTVALSSTPARADTTKAQCIDANGKGQELRRDGKLSGAREQFRQCADASCPAILRDDCTRRLDDVETAQPTLIFEAKDGAGNDVGAVKVTVDGAPLTEHLGGTAVRVEPGEHTFTFEAEGLPTLQKKLIIREGEKDRRERIAFGTAETASPAASPAGSSQTTSPSAQPPTSAAPSEASSGLGTQKILAIVAGGVGVVGLGLGSAFGLMAISKKNDAQKSCPGTCADDTGVNAWNDAISAGNVSTALFIVGGVGLAGAAALWFTAPSSSSASGTQVGFGLGGVQVRGTW